MGPDRDHLNTMKPGNISSTYPSPPPTISSRIPYLLLKSFQRRLSNRKVESFKVHFYVILNYSII